MPPGPAAQTLRAGDADYVACIYILRKTHRCTASEGHWYLPYNQFYINLAHTPLGPRQSILRVTPTYTLICIRMCLTDLPFHVQRRPQAQFDERTSELRTYVVPAVPTAQEPQLQSVLALLVCHVHRLHVRLAPPRHDLHPLDCTRGLPRDR